MSAQTLTRPGRRTTVLACGLACGLALAGALAGDPAAVRRVRSDPGAVGLLRAAADAARRVPYEGRRFLTTWSRNRSSTSLVAVSHTPGEGVRYHRSGPSGSTGSASSTGEVFRPDPAGGGDAGLTSATLALLTRNYSVVRAADTTVCGRRARVVEARRADGTAAGRFWLDAQTGLVLHRELIDATGRPVVVSGFTEISYTVQAKVAVPYGLGGTRGGISRFPGTGTDGSAAARGGGHVAALWGDRLDRADLAGLRERGWPVPKDLPGHLTLYEARRETGGDGPVHLSYSDGLASVSVFVQRGRLDERAMTGWRRGVRSGRTVFRREELRRWAVSAGRGYVYTVLTDAPQSTAVAVAASMPGGSTPFWTRVSRGAHRLASSVNPFD
ncbi:sigma-E factor regulatory protein RseB domain-containing protein [Actinomadura syzygii]|uniref:MucB/RseB N-terminal domain-containing protein n=1 Tax=Actinomadura syzygii TaxID=1427538 RepID=A0A5D0U5T9_9ACTN|nr:sigma-E factor regulatory protein RseB domain-containing protein [Actinomadura syzygii]TYC13768.1 hypothetical protein FXF65_19080 [Actinomadura syzygii]